jgi:hypothetical protein
VKLQRPGRAYPMLIGTQSGVMTAPATKPFATSFARIHGVFKNLDATQLIKHAFALRHVSSRDKASQGPSCCICSPEPDPGRMDA